MSYIKYQKISFRIFMDYYFKKACEQRNYKQLMNIKTVSNHNFIALHP